MRFPGHVMLDMRVYAGAIFFGVVGAGIGVGLSPIVNLRDLIAGFSGWALVAFVVLAFVASRTTKK